MSRRCIVTLSRGFRITNLLEVGRPSMKSKRPDGWRNQTTANAWTTKMANFFQINDLFKHPTNASGGDYWPHGDSVNDFSNTENYGATTASNWASIIQKLWNGYLKPAIVGESTNSNAHTNLWATLSTGIAITPLMWQFNANSSVWSSHHNRELAARCCFC